MYLPYAMRLLAPPVLMALLWTCPACAIEKDATSTAVLTDKHYTPLVFRLGSGAVGNAPRGQQFH